MNAVLLLSDVPCNSFLLWLVESNERERNWKIHRNCFPIVSYPSTCPQREDWINATRHMQETLEECQNQTQSACRLPIRWKVIFRSRLLWQTTFTVGKSRDDVLSSLSLDGASSRYYRALSEQQNAFECRRKTTHKAITSNCVATPNENKSVFLKPRQR